MAKNQDERQLLENRRQLLESVDSFRRSLSMAKNQDERQLLENRRQLLESVDSFREYESQETVDARRHLDHVLRELESFEEFNATYNSLKKDVTLAKENYRTLVDKDNKERSKVLDKIRRLIWNRGSSPKTIEAVEALEEFFVSWSARPDDYDNRRYQGER